MASFENEKNRAKKLLSRGNIEGALEIYREIEKKIYRQDEPNLYVHIKHNEGYCYENMAKKENKEENLKRAIRSYMEVSDILKPWESPYKYAITKNNLGCVYLSLAEIEDKEKNLVKAIASFEEAVEALDSSGKDIAHQMEYNDVKRNLEKARSISKADTSPGAIFIKDSRKVKEFTSADGTKLKELISPEKDPITTRYSLALATILPGEESFPHRLKSSSEVYVIIRGEGIMHIEEEARQVREGHIVYVPPNSLQYIENTGSEALVFYCVVDPPWREEDEVVIV